MVAEVVAQACVMTVAGDKEFFLGESSLSYLSASRINVRTLSLSLSLSVRHTYTPVRERTNTETHLQRELP